MVLATSTLINGLQQLLAAELGSLTGQLEAAKPHLSAHAYRVWAQVRHLHDVSQHAAAELTHLLLQLGTEPHPTDFNVHVADFNYDTLESLLPRLLRELTVRVRRYDAAVAACDDAAIRRRLAVLRDDAKSTLTQLETAQRQLSATPV